MAQRRNVFGAEYGTTKIERAKPRAPRIAPQQQPPVPLSWQAQAPLPNEQPVPGQVPASGQGALHPQDEDLLQRLLARFGGPRG